MSSSKENQKGTPSNHRAADLTVRTNIPKNKGKGKAPAPPSEEPEIKVPTIGKRSASPLPKQHQNPYTNFLKSLSEQLSIIFSLSGSRSQPNRKQTPIPELHSRPELVTTLYDIGDEISDFRKRKWGKLYNVLCGKPDSEDSDSVKSKGSARASSSSNSKRGSIEKNGWKIPALTAALMTEVRRTKEAAEKAVEVVKMIGGVEKEERVGDACEFVEEVLVEVAETAGKALTKIASAIDADGGRAGSR